MPDKPTIKQLRLEKGFKPSHLAREAGVSVFTIYRIDKGGQGVSTEILARVCSALGVSLHDVKEGENR